jgi:hypothetical protein
MRLNKRMVLMGLVVMALMILSMTLSMARSWPTNPIFLAPGIREAGAYTKTISPYGHLIPILPFPGEKEPGRGGDVLIPSRTGKTGGDAGAYANSQGNSSRVNPGPQPIGSNKSSGTGLAAGSSGMPMGNYFSGAVAVNRVEYLENDLRETIRRLNAK